MVVVAEVFVCQSVSPSVCLFVAGVLVPVNEIPFLKGTVEVVASSLGCNKS